jgi:plasmid stability protein
MTSIRVRNLDDETLSRLISRANDHRQSVEAEIRQILDGAVNSSNTAGNGLGTDIANLFAGIGLRPGEEIREWKGSYLKDLFGV